MLNPLDDLKLAEPLGIRLVLPPTKRRIERAHVCTARLEKRGGRCATRQPTTRIAHMHQHSCAG